MITPLLRFTYANVFEPKANLSGALKYSCGLMIPKTDTAAIAAIKHEIDEAIKKGIADGIFNAAASKSRTFKYPMRDGDGYFAEKPEAGRSCYQGHMFLSAASDNPVGVVDKYLRPIIDPSEFYSGCWGHADVRLYAFNKGGGIGIGVGLNNLMKAKDDDRLDGRQSAQQAFAGHAAADTEAEGEDLQ